LESEEGVRWLSSRWDLFIIGY